MAAPIAALAVKAAKQAAIRLAQRKLSGQKNSSSGGGGGGKGGLWGALAGVGMVVALALLSLPSLLIPSGPQNQEAKEAQEAPPNNCQPAKPGGGGGGGGAGETVDSLSATQRQHAEVIVKTVKANGGNDLAAMVALSVAMVETRLRNLASDESSQSESQNYPNDGVDQDGKSVGIFQQQPWWGSIEDRMDVATSTKLFVKGTKGVPGLLSIKGWEQMKIGDAAQEVQKSRYGAKYAEWESFAKELITSISGTPPADVPGDCGPTVKDGTCPTSSALETALSGVQPDTMLVARCVAARFPKIKTYYGVREDAMPYHPSGKAVDIMISGAFGDYNSSAAVDYGDKIAAFLEKNAEDLGIDAIIWRQRIWNPKRADEDWRSMTDRGSPTANHFDHIHVQTYGNSGNSGAFNGGTGKGVMPLPAGKYSLGAVWGATGNWSTYHTGQDLAAPIGTPVRAVADGVVVNVTLGTSLWCGVSLGITYASGHSSLMCHMSKATVQVGDKVTAGQTVGYVGMTGRTFGPHLHFEHYPPGIRPGDLYKSTDPMAWLKTLGASGKD